MFNTFTFRRPHTHRSHSAQTYRKRSHRPRYVSRRKITIVDHSRIAIICCDRYKPCPIEKKKSTSIIIKYNCRFKCTPTVHNPLLIKRNENSGYLTKPTIESYTFIIHAKYVKYVWLFLKFTSKHTLRFSLKL